MELNLSHYGEVIATDERGQEVYDKIRNEIINSKKIIIDANNVTISTKTARLIFGRLYKEFNVQFIELVSFKNKSPLFSFALNEGIATEMEN